MWAVWWHVVGLLPIHASQLSMPTGEETLELPVAMKALLKAYPWCREEYCSL